MKDIIVNWDNLNRFQLGKYAEYYAKMEFTLFGFDVFTPEIDDKGIDFIAKKSKNGEYLEIQVKAIRKLNTVFMQKVHFDITKENLYLVLLIFSENKMPDMFLIPAKTWGTPNKLFVGGDFGKPGQTSPPEWRLNLSTKNLDKLNDYQFDDKIKEIAMEQ